MKLTLSIKSTLMAVMLSLFSSMSAATIVEFKTSLGNIEVNLFDNTTPQTVANFLNYATNESYNNTVIHRSISNFVVQGGGFTFDGESLVKLATNDAVRNEPLYSNVKGTIAMAKFANDPHSATNQWFFNMTDNSHNLDSQNSGFTVFGQVISGMDVLEAIQGLVHCNDVPLVNYTSQQCYDDSSQLGFENYVTIINVEIKDATVDTANELTPILAKLVTGDSGVKTGGAMGFVLLVSAIVMFVLRRKLV